MGPQEETLSETEGSGSCREERGQKRESETEKNGGRQRTGMEGRKQRGKEKKERWESELTLRKLNSKSMPRRE